MFGLKKGQRFDVAIEPDEDGVFVATIPALPGCVSDGDTPEEALAHVKEAAECYLEAIAKEGRLAPEWRGQVRPIEIHV